MRKGASVSQLLALISEPVGDLITRVLSRRVFIEMLLLTERSGGGGLGAAEMGIAAGGIEVGRHRHDMAPAPAPAMQGVTGLVHADVEHGLLLMRRHDGLDRMFELIDGHRGD